MKTIIKGAIYTEGSVLLRPHYSGNFSMVDCTEYKTIKDIKADYAPKYVNEFKKCLCLTFEGVKYYECEYSPYCTDDMELLSDISNLDFYDEDTEF